MSRRRPFIRSAVFISCSLVLSSAFVLPALAQTCAPQVLLSIARSGTACANLEPGQACFGGGEGTFTLQDGTTNEAQAGDRVPTDIVTSVAVEDAGEADDAPLSIASLNVAVSPNEDDRVFMLLVNEAQVSSTARVLPEVGVIAIGLLPVRTAPHTNADVITELAINAGADANGRTADGVWLRVRLQTTGSTGWVAASSVTVRGDVTDLEVVTEESDTAQPFQLLYLDLPEAGEGACGETLRSGVLLQTPSTELNENAVNLFINSANPMRIAGTVFLFGNTSERGFGLIVLDGAVELVSDDGTTLVPAGTQQVDGQPAPYDQTFVAALPINNLPRRFQIAPPLAEDAIEGAILALNPPTPTPFVPMPTPEDQCRRAVGRDTTVWAGPGENYEALSELEAGTPITPVLATEGSFGGTWWQLENSGWIEQRIVVERGNCTEQAVPVTQRVPAPRTNTYSLERCESNNGPVRSGQYVTIEFVPPAWPSLAEATIAVRTDPGTFTINADRYRASFTDPIRLGTVNPLEDRYVRRFTLQWQATPGTFRITGDWLTYEPACNLTVPVE